MALDRDADGSKAGDGQRAWEGRRKRALVRAVGVLAAHLVVVALGVLLGLWPGPAKVGRPTGPTPDCRSLLPDDDLAHLSLRPPRAAQRQLDRWDRCDASTGQPDRTTDRSRTALRWDWLLIATLAAGFGLSAVLTWRRRRWRLAAWIGGLSALVYVGADVLENVGLLGELDDPRPWAGWLQWAGAMKLGALAGAGALFLISLARAAGNVGVVVSDDAWNVRVKTAAAQAEWQRSRAGEDRRERLRSFVDRFAGRLATPEEVVADAEWIAPPRAELGICCSGGGIRSAAFNLGALQSLQEQQSSDGTPELERASWLSAVSGGSYIAAAWVTARGYSREPVGYEDAWLRLSKEEDHLRRNASYLAPGFSGKLWALARFLFGFVLNLALIGLLLGAMFLPFGWLIRSWERPRPMTAGELVLPQGACLRLPDGRTAAVLPDARLRVAPDQTAAIDPAAPRAQVEARRPAPVTCAAPEAGGAAVRGLTGQVPKGSPVRLVTRPLQVTGRSVRGCTDGAASSNTPAPPAIICRPEDGREFRAPTGTMLISSPEAVLTLDGPALVRRGILVRPCGGKPCWELHQPRAAALLVGAFTGLALMTGLALVVARASPSTARRTERWARRLGAAAAVSALVVYVLPALVAWTQKGRGWFEEKAAGTGTAGTGAVLLTLVAQVLPYLRAGKAATAGGRAEKVVGVARRAAAGLRRLAVRLAGAVVGPIVVLLAALGFASYAADWGWSPGQLGLWVAVAAVLLVIGSGADLNEWSLHPYYRDHLRSAFAVDPRAWPPTDPREDPLDGYDPARRPRLLICAAVNLADRHVAAPGRPVASWVFEVGDRGTGPTGARLGSDAMRQAPALLGRASRTEALLPAQGMVPPHRFPPELRHLTWTWTAVAVSGAAFSPAMGKMTTPERFLLALGNLRLGVWYPNPRFLADEKELPWYEVHHPRPWYLAKEALGLHKANDRWLYISDGGHYENLGLVELLRRGCREIYCFDASGDSPDTFGTLAEAMRLAREELGVHIEIDPTPMKPNASGISPLGVWAGTVTFRGEHEPSGWLVIAKLAVPATAPFDVVDLARTLPAFPNSPTADQLYTDQKLEAYRALGHHLGGEVLKLADRIRGRVEAGHSRKDAVRLANASQRG